ncbi:MAG: restriction endonuclease, partial [Gemmatimonadota bacterium]|nr:restriction endonuclease [Gemmatimonadota bacterium]
MRHRLQNSFGDDVKNDYEVIGEPVDLSGARALAKLNRHQFELWALGLVGARPAEKKKGADKGIDGRLYFHDDPKSKSKQIIISVKSGHTGVSHIRDLRGVLEREKADIGVLITLEKPTKPMRAEAAGAGFYESKTWNTKHHFLQILTIEDLLSGKSIDCPPYQQVSTTFKKAPRKKSETKDTQNNLNLD